MNKKQAVNFTLNLYLQEKNNKPAIELRTLTSDTTCMREIIESALMDRPIFVFPIFRDKLMALSRLAEKGIMKYDYDKGKYEFLI